MNTEHASTTSRYQLLEMLGTGSMGSVWRAYDRLRVQRVALKQVTVAPAQLTFGSRPLDDDHEALLLALTHEFRTLAGLRHPHIISVLDYGFDSMRQPFFTMDILESAQTILEAGKTASFEQKIRLLIQILEALAYLHRRDILHHDLKPANVMVSQGEVRLLDFGLAVIASQERSDDGFGTIQYLAPEILDLQPYTAAADLYSLGVIAYELLIGHHPFQADTVQHYFDQLFHSAPDLGYLQTEPALVLLLDQLLAKSPQDRPVSAQAVIHRLHDLLGHSFASDTTQIRESYLQAAAFVGREKELATLSSALEQAGLGKGSSWLIGGESGVGKSRLLEELRVQALVQGFQVLYGQAAEGGGLPYQIWRDPVRQLTLHTQLSDLEAAVIQEIVPDIELVLGREIESVPLLPGEAGRQRLVNTIIALLRRQTQPVLLLVEDLQWLSESLIPLYEVNRWVAELALLVIGSYRDDERPDLAARLPGMQLLKLERLNQDAIADLSASMLGEVGRTPSVLSLLQRETEGNTFFMVEVVRALAEEAGSLALVGRSTLPKHMFTGGVQQVLRRRLARVPEQLWKLLKLAAVAGRELDFVLMQRFALPKELQQWQRICADAAIIEVYDSRWRFAHDKLREVVLADLPADERPGLHRQIAEALEALYPGHDELSERLMEHWRVAGDSAHELDYMLRVMVRWIDYGLNYRGACSLLEHGIESAGHLSDEYQWLIRMYNWLGKAYERLNDFPAADEAYHQARDRAEQRGDKAGLAMALRGTGRTAWRQGQVVLGQERCEQALVLYTELQNQKGIADCFADIGIMEVEQHHFGRGEELLQRALHLFKGLQDMDGIFGCLNDLGLSRSYQGDKEQADAYLQQALNLARDINHRTGIAFSLLNLGIEAFEAGDSAYAHTLLSECLEIAREIDDNVVEANNLSVLGLIAREEGLYAMAESYFQQALDICRTTNTPLQESMVLRELGSLARYQHNQIAALAYYSQSIELCRQLQHSDLIATLSARALLHLEQHDRVAALHDLVEALQRAKEYQVVPLTAVALTVWARLLLFDGQPEAAAELLGLTERIPALGGHMRRYFIDPLLTLLEKSLTAEQLNLARQRGAGKEIGQVVDEILDSVQEHSA